MLSKIVEGKRTGLSLDFADSDLIPVWARESVAFLYKNQVISGYTTSEGENVFKPNASITRAEVCQMLFNAIEADGGSLDSLAYSDQIPDWAKEAISVLSKEGMIKGYDNGTFCADQNMTREEAATILYNLLKYLHI